MNRVGALLRCGHPAPAAAVTILSGLIAGMVGHGTGGVLLVAAVIGTSQLAVAWANDAIDAPRDRAVRRQDKPLAVEWPQGRTAVAIAAVGASVLMCVIALSSGLRPGLLAVVGLVSAQLYNWPLKSTVFSIVPYVISFAAIPAFIIAAVPADPPLPLVFAAAFFGGAAHLLNAVPDLAADEATGVRGLPQILGPSRSRALAAALTGLAVFALL
ncbi:UbiA family prenyltransferase [Hamadaea tsunoensis]|uniref:UbiA family prenyltransferase n=1 Tax=Hamadaea tsunoensis TaxID=53368 RepID=UPI0003F8A078|nr:UbiA family prenyltransferase [Hamadaea tsunoensis]